MAARLHRKSAKSSFQFKSEKSFSILVLSFMGFLRFSELSNWKRSDFNIHNTHMSIFIEKSKTDI